MDPDISNDESFTTLGKWLPGHRDSSLTVVIAHQIDAADGADGAVSNVVVADRGAAAQCVRTATAITTAVIAH